MLPLEQPRRDEALAVCGLEPEPSEPAAAFERHLVPMLASGLSGKIREDRLTLDAGAGGVLDVRAGP